MAREAERDGIGVVCATPHIRARPRRAHRAAARAGGRSSSASSTSAACGCGSRRAAEVCAALAAERSQRGAPARRSRSDGGGWILLEPAPGALADELATMAQRLAARGARTIVAHPERHAGADFEQRLRALAAHGCLIQWTADFIVQADPANPDALRAAARARGPRAPAGQRRALLPRWTAAAPERRLRAPARSVPARAASNGSPSRRRRRFCAVRRSRLPGSQAGRQAAAATGQGSSMTASASCSTTSREACPSPRRRKFAAPAAAPSTTARSKALAEAPTRRRARPSSSRRNPRGSRARSGAGSAARHDPRAAPAPAAPRG